MYGRQRSLTMEIEVGAIAAWILHQTAFPLFSYSKRNTCRTTPHMTHACA